MGHGKKAELKGQTKKLVPEEKGYLEVKNSKIKGLRRSFTHIHEY